MSLNRGRQRRKRKRERDRARKKAFASHVADVVDFVHPIYNVRLLDFAVLKQGYANIITSVQSFEDFEDKFGPLLKEVDQETVDAIAKIIKET